MHHTHATKVESLLRKIVHDRHEHEIAQKEAIVLQPPVDRPYSMRECTVATPDGHRFVVGQSND
ncbi:hypothetical protein [Paraburkholderia sp. J7]|uniref:hypothetical protein n=1 Tax=Paraburkholderia sp. J7 TaxID=2805438 RepID=UPI002AB6AD25|nr:hypothetical protein [Paraburkholderia sp. J7]